ncbi:TPA: hypothetical protein ACKZVW_000101, partial [Streptococcus pyogenes]
IKHIIKRDPKIGFLPIFYAIYALFVLKEVLFYIFFIFFEPNLSFVTNLIRFFTCNSMFLTDFSF